MENDVQNLEAMKPEAKKDRLLPTSIFIAAVIIGGSWIYTTGLKYEHGALVAVKNGNLAEAGAPASTKTSAGELEAKVLPQEGVVLPISWGDLGARMVSAGVIDAEKFEELYVGRGGLDEEAKQLLYGGDQRSVRMTPKNSGTILNLLWAFGLANKNQILEEGPMTNYDGKEPSSPAEALAKAGRFASTGGWTLAKGDATEHYSRHNFVALTADEQALVERVSQNIYRPCCGNPTYFPDCNHGMAMLGLLELLAANGASEEETYRIALRVNSYWFPDTYLTIASLFEKRGVRWENVDPREILGTNYSSARGFQRVLAEVEPVEQRGGGGCGV